MLRGLPASLFLHAAVVGVGYVTWPYMSATTGDDAPVIVAVDLITIGELDNLAAIRDPEPVPEPEEEPVEEPEPEEPDPVDEPEDPVDETLPEDDITTASSEPQPEPDVPQETVPDFQEDAADALEDLLETPPPEAPTPPQRNALDDFLSDAESTFASERQTRKRQEPAPAPKRILEDNPVPPTQRRGAGERNANTARLESVLYSMIKPCWGGVDDQPNADELNVVLELRLDENGNLDRLRLVQPSREPLGRSPMRVAIERARTAVRKCAPYRLPREEYEVWQLIKVNLGPEFENTGPPQ